MNRAQRRAYERRLAGIDQTQRRLQEELRLQAVELRATVPSPGETIEQALEAIDAGIADLSEPRWSAVAGPAVEELRACREDLLRRKAAD